MVPSSLLFLSTLPARGATIQARLFQHHHDISIHAPREGSDPSNRTVDAGAGYISIHAPREGSDPSDRAMDAGAGNISIHAPREGSDLSERVFDSVDTEFLSTLPARGATLDAWHYADYYEISIHAPREGSDCCSLRSGTLLLYFYPRSPRGERPAPSFYLPLLYQNFYPRSPRGERRLQHRDCIQCPSISIHAPREGSDRCSPIWAKWP